MKKRNKESNKGDKIIRDKKNKTIKFDTSSYSALLEYVSHKQYGLANLGISDKTSFDWRNKGVYLKPKTTKFRMKYSPVEYIWLLLVKELREFGMPLKSVLKLKEFLTDKIDVEGLMGAMYSLSGEGIVSLQRYPEEIEFLSVERKKLRRELKGLDNLLINTFLTSIVVTTLMKEETYVLYIKRDGVCAIETLSGDNLAFVDKNDSSLLVPFNKIVNQFLEKEGLMEEYNKQCDLIWNAWRNNNA